ncbi:MAG: WG repeat-containing protein [Acidimicrobiia bacterium]|nr:WG repeat-containing protein [Acidimicrobiia bacterium]
MGCSPRFESVDRFSEGLAAVMQNGNWGYISRDGRMRIPLKFRYAKSFTGGKASVGYAGQHGYIDRQGIFYPIRRTWSDAMSDLRNRIRTPFYPEDISTPTM